MSVGERGEDAWHCVVDFDILSRIAAELDGLTDGEIIDLQNRLVWHLWRPGPRHPDADGLGRLCVEDCVVQESLACALEGRLPDKGCESICDCFGRDVAWLCETILLDGLRYPAAPPEARAERLIRGCLAGIA